MMLQRGFKAKDGKGIFLVCLAVRTMSDSDWLILMRFC